MSGERRETLLERLLNPDGVLSRTDVAGLGHPRRAVDAIFRAATTKGGVIVLPGYSRPMIRVATYRAVLEDATYRGDRVVPS